MFCSNVTSILLDGVSVLIFGKPNEEDERGTKEGVLAQSMHLLLLAKGNKWILKRLGILVRMVKYQTLKTITTTIKQKKADRSTTLAYFYLDLSIRAPTLQHFYFITGSKLLFMLFIYPFFFFPTHGSNSHIFSTSALYSITTVGLVSQIFVLCCLFLLT